MNVSHWVISQGEWSTVDQCEEAKRGFVILYGQWDTAKCLSRDTLGHFCSSNKWDTHTHGHAYIHKRTQTHNPRNPTASSLVILIGYSDGVLLWTPSWQTKLESKRGTEGGRKGRGKQTKKTLPPSLLPQPSLVDGTGSFLSFLLIGHPGIDSGVSSTPKHVHVPRSHETPPGYSPLTLPFKWLGGGGACYRGKWKQLLEEMVKSFCHRCKNSHPSHQL